MFSNLYYLIWVSRDDRTFCRQQRQEMFILLFLLLFANKDRIGDGFSIYTNNSPNYSDVSYLKPFILNKLNTIHGHIIRNGETVLCLSKGTNHFINIIWTVTDIIWCFITAVKQILILNLTTSVARLQPYLTVSQLLGDKPKWLLATNLSGCWLQTVSTHF